MENKINVGNQNTQPVGQNPVAQPTVPDKPKTNLTAIIVVSVLCSLVFGVGGYFLGKQNSNLSGQKPLNNDTVLPSTIPSTTPLSQEQNLIDTSDWIESGSRADGFTVKHPKNITYGETSDNYAHFIMFDESNLDKYKIKEIEGLEFRIKRVQYPTTQTLEQVVEKEVANSKEVGDVLETTKPISIGSYSGFTYKSRGLGTHKYYFLAIDPKDYVFPNQKDYFYIINSSTEQNNILVETILSTLKNSRI
ncbi:MAG: hypothetical protein HYU80_04005 [Candidatus Blackburnbacteria bacterium]|nr:hypothetical protein [Candidatus Blackburnbacteria bacterium]